jgi:hypothetical protein
MINNARLIDTMSSFLLLDPRNSHWPDRHE